jgi:hypothetical protein
MTKVTFKLDPEKYPGDSIAEKGAFIATDAGIKGAMTTHIYTSNLAEIDSLALVSRVQQLTEDAVAGDLGQMEAMLAAQAIALDAIFHRLAGQAHQNIGQHANAVDTYLRLGLKAQAQCRSSIEALAALKTPKQYISQTNVANTMQINNSPERIAHEERMDFRAQAAAGRNDSALAALEAINGGKDNGRQEC